MKLLIVEDSLLVRERLTAFFAKVPTLEIEAAANAADAFAHFRTWRPDVAILDIGLPDGNGLHVLRTVKHELPATRILMFSSHDSCRESCRAAGADGFFDKADDFDSLAEAVGLLAAAHQAGDPSWATGPSFWGT